MIEATQDVKRVQAQDGPAGEKGAQSWQNAWQSFQSFLRAPGPAAPSLGAAEAGSDVGDDLTGADWLRGLLLRMRPAYKQAIWMALAVNSLALLTAIFTMQVYDRVVAHAGYSTLAALVMGMLVVVALDYFLRTGRALLLQRVGGRIEVEIARAVFQRLLRLPALELEKRSPAYWQAMFRDIELLRSTCAGATAMLLIDLPFLLLSFALIAVIALPLLPVVFLTMTAFVALAWYSGRSARENNEREKERVINRDIAIAELSGARLALKALGASEAASVRWESHYALWMRESMLRSQESDRYRDMANELTTLNMVMTTTFGALAILSQLMSLGALIAANILAGKLVAPLVQLVGQWRSWGQFLAAKRRIDALMVIDLEREHTDVTLPRPKGVLRMEEVEFSYPESSAPQIHQVSGQIGPNGLHAIVGSNGSGKTTLLKLLRGLYLPSKGRIVLDGADLKQFSQKDLSRWIGYLPQQIHLVSGTVRDNLTLSSLDASDEQIVRATTLACAHGFLVDLPDGYGTQVGEGGMRFSGGQRKRIAIAQVLLHDPAILLLDEPTSDLDRDAEQAFIGTLRELARDHTVIVVTHSPAILAHCNGLIVMDKGRIVAAGPASQLLPSLGMAARTEEAPRAA